MSRALFTAVSGLRNHQLWLDVIGNNIANANTTGFKAAATGFEDVLSQTLGSGSAPGPAAGGTNPLQVGLGVKLATSGPVFLQGSVQTTNRSTDLAIQGDGFFTLTDGADLVYTRAGAFTLDAGGTLVDGGNGWKVMGTAGAITIPLGQERAATATSLALFRGNLDAAAADGTSYVATLDVRDSLGTGRALTLTFTRNFAAAPGQWDWTASAADPAVESVTDGAGSLVFDAAGALVAGHSQSITIVYSATSAVLTPQPVTLDFGTAANPTPVTGLALPSTLVLADQDGAAAGSLQNFAVGADGAITGFYSNGETEVLDTIQLASFTNPAGLLRVGANQFRESPGSGPASIGAPGSGVRGTLVAGALEQSTVDLAQEFTAMIIAERGFQANARTISTADRILEELINLRR